MALGMSEAFLILLAFIGVAGFFARIIALVHVLARDELVGRQKFAWGLLVVFVPLAQWVYLFMPHEKSAEAFRPPPMASA